MLLLFQQRQGNKKYGSYPPRPLRQVFEDLQPGIEVSQHEVENNCQRNMYDMTPHEASLLVGSENLHIFAPPSSTRNLDSAVRQVVTLVDQAIGDYGIILRSQDN